MIEWRSVVGFPAYKVSSSGQVWSIETGRILRPWRHRSGHLYLKLARDGRKRGVQVHRLVLEAFIGLAGHRQEACHCDGNHTNNRLDNLYWGTRAQNIDDYARMAHRYAKSAITFERADEIRRRYRGVHGEQSSLAREFEVSVSVVHKIVHGITYTRSL